MSKNIILKKYPEIDYVLVARVREDESVNKFVAAWSYDENSKSWGAGHYFQDLEDAIDYIHDIYRERLGRFKTCTNCKYYLFCGDPNRIAKCDGKELR